MDAHDAAVSAIADRLRSFNTTKTPFRIYHGSTNSTRRVQFDKDATIDTSSLNHVLSVDTSRKTALVEPNVAMDELVAALLPHDLVPPVVMEFPGITVGGGFAGVGGESSSFKYGWFHDTVNWIEIVLPDGEICRASREERADLFEGAAGSFGTLGIATVFEIQLIPARTYVEVVYHEVGSVGAAVEKMREATGNPLRDGRFDYVDGIMFSKDRTVVMTGRLTDEVHKDARVQRFTRAQDPWFYIHADRVVRGASKPVIEAVPLQDYLFRYDRGAFWTGMYAFKYFLTPFNRITRWLLDGFMRTRVMFHAAHASGLMSRYIVQDLGVPEENVEAFIDFVDDEFGFYPLWLCPLKGIAPHTRHSKSIGAGPDGQSSGRTMNVGVWGPGPNDHTKFIAANRSLEQKVLECGGLKWLYARAYYTEDEFWRIYDKEKYDELRRRYKASSLPSMFDKVKMSLEETGSEDLSWQDTVWTSWPFAGLYGVYRTLMSREYLLASK